MGVRRTALTSLASYGVPVLIGLVAMPIVFRILGAPQFGVLSIALISPALAASLDLGVTSAAVRRLAPELERPTSTLGSTLGSYAVALFVVGAGLGIAVAAAAPLLNDWLGFGTVLGTQLGIDLIRLCALWMALSLAFALPGIVLRAKQRFAELTAVQTASTLALWITAIALAAAGSSLWSIVATAALITAASAVACFVLARHEVPGGTRLRVDAALVMEDAHFSSGLFLVQLSNVVAFQLDRLIVAALASPAAAGLDALCVGIANKTLFTVSALTSFAYPRVAAMRARGQEAEIGSLLQALLRVAVVVVAPSLLPALFLAGPFLALWLGAGAGEDAAALLQLLWIGYSIAAICAPATHVITGTGTSRLAATFAWVTATLLLTSMYLFVPRLGLLGAGVANVIAMSSALVFLAIVRRTLAVPPDPSRGRLLAGLVAAFLVQGTVLGLLRPYATSWLTLLLAASAGLAAYQTVRWALRTVTGEEQRLLNSLITRFKR